MKYTNNARFNVSGFWITRDNHHVISAEIEKEEDFHVDVRNWSTGESYVMPRNVVSAMHPMPDAAITGMLAENGFIEHNPKLWKLGARIHLRRFELSYGNIVWSNPCTKLELALPDTIVTVEAVRQAAEERLGKAAAEALLFRASRIAFLAAGQEAFDLTPDVKDA